MSDFHRSEARTWHSEIPVIGVRELLAVRIDQFITEEGETEAPEIVIDGKVGEVGDLYNFSIGDAERLASALSVMLERIAAEHYSTAAREWLAITQETISRM